MLFVLVVALLRKYSPNVSVIDVSESPESVPFPNDTFTKVQNQGVIAEIYSV